MEVKGVIGRKEEIKILERIQERDEAQLVAIYGRRRVGKTFLVKKFYNEKFDFFFTGSYNTSTEVQLALFQHTLQEYSKTEQPHFNDWFEAFAALRDYLSGIKKGNVVVFLDEIPWMERPNSNFLSAFSFFWNQWVGTMSGLKLIICGSATTWMLDHIVGDMGGFYGRSNLTIHLSPFNLSETEMFLKSRRFQYQRRQIAESYMIFGGIPYYLDMLDPKIPFSNNVDALFFADNAPLRNEYEFLFRTLFRNSKIYHNVVAALADNAKGMTQKEVKECIKRQDGGDLSEVLRNLQKCDFVRTYNSFGKKEKDAMYQLTDLFTLFHLRFVRRDSGQDARFWSNISDHARDSWQGHAFEMLCLHHIPQIKNKLGISGILTNAFSWSTPPKTDKDGGEWKGAQIDLLLERADNIISVCEIKYCKDLYAITEAYDARVRERMATFVHHTKTRCSLQCVFITTFGLMRNAFYDNVQSEVMLDDLFC